MPQSVRGMVVRVEARSLTELEFLDVRDDAGFVWRFRPGVVYRASKLMGAQSVLPE